MAFTDTGFKRSMKITITKTGNDGTVVSTTYDGQEAFDTFFAVADNNTFRQLERNQDGNGDWDVRLVAFKNYILGEVGQDVYDQIDWDANVVLPLNEYNIMLMSVFNSNPLEIVAVVYKDGILASVNETVNVYFNTQDKIGVQLQIAGGNYISGTYQMDEFDGFDIADISSPTVSPESSENGIYNVTIDLGNQWQV